MSDDYQSETVEEVQPTTGYDEVTSSDDEGIEQGIDNEEVQSDISDAPQGNLVPREVVESMREQIRESRDREQQLLQLILAGKQPGQEQSQQKQEDQFPFADDEFLTGAQLKAILAQQDQHRQAQSQAQQDQQRQAYIAEQKETYIKQYPDYNEVLKTVQDAAQSNPAMAEIIMHSKNPVEMAYQYGKILRGESLGEVKTVKEKVSQEKKIQANLNQPRTLSNVKGTALSGVEDLSPEAVYQSRFNS